ncbi:transmembrane and coiled-coil domains protein 2 isoform X5 [Homalodisca vitripennis]|uniref:transmembrane and coiled-coil domains protein 2 isoform X5 n=1 Tax=Homalodisca vitripennis TaxID=197043 RepID=UPI001EEC4061|nr:transmembrane and coiled-coil domains protein 2 isoform X5 [Homalodisca vitripennis]
MDSLQVSGSSKHSSRSPSPCRLSGKNNAGPHLVDGSMSRCKSPVTSRHERGGSNDAAMVRPDTSSNHGSDDPPPNNDDEPDLYLQSASFISNGSNELVEDCDGEKTKAAIEHISNKINRTRDQIRGEQTARDDNVDEYLKLASNADKVQLTRIKAVFEKKNQKSAQNISQLQKKLESYNKKLRELEMHGVSGHHHRQPREMLRDMGQGLKSVMSKPREFAHLIRNKFGSADNINSMSRSGETDGEEGGERGHHGSATLPGNCSLGSTHSATGLKFPSDDGSECSSVTSESVPGATTASPHSIPTHTHPHPQPAGYEVLLAEVRRNKQEIERLKDKMEAFKQAVHKEVTYLSHALTEERFRSERLEEQVNDLTELHQNEVENLKTTITDMEEKVQYQSEERLRDIHEVLESCQTKISKMEHQQAQHQQYLTLEGLDNSSARALVVKCINVVVNII